MTKKSPVNSFGFDFERPFSEYQSILLKNEINVPNFPSNIFSN